jgi:hypothetical protein
LLIFFILITFFLKRRRTLKKLVVFLLVSLFAVSTAYASELELSGSAFIKGVYSDALVGAGEADDDKNYESDFEVKAAFVVDENTKANLVVETFDHDWNDPANPTDQGADIAALQVTTATITHTFTTGTTFDGGFAGVGHAWGTAFGDDANDAYYLRATQAFEMGSVIAWTEKITEDTSTDATSTVVWGDHDGDNGAVTPEQAYEVATAATTDEDDDVDAYGLGAELKFGELTVMPSVYYKDDKATDDNNMTEVSIALTGAVAGIDLECEAVYQDMEANDDATYGVLASASKAMNALTLGGTFVYCSSEGDTDDPNNASFNAGDEMGLMEQISDDFDMNGVTFFKGSASYAVNDKLTVGGAAAYWMGSDSSDETAAYEVDLTASYSITPAVTYSAGVSYLDGDDNDGNELADASVYAYHTFNVAF